MAFLTCQTVLGFTMFTFTKIGGGLAKTVSSSWISALSNAVVMSTLDVVVSCANAKLNLILSKGVSRFVVVVERCPHGAKFPQMTHLVLCL